jgi:nitrite reductase/ring-hydroxylating ferredoxin subunit
MNILKSKYWLFFLTLIACEPNLSDDPVPYIAFTDIVINLNLPEFIALRSDGGHKEINGGVRGIIIYRINSNTYKAYERNCTFQPNSACATVNVHTSNLFMTDPCCGSNFTFEDGNPSGGPAWRPLVNYRTEVSGTDLIITSIIN